MTTPSASSRMRRLAIVTLAVAVLSAGLAMFTAMAQENPLTQRLLDYRSLDGSGNNPFDPALGRAGTTFTRVAAAHYADGVAAMVDGPEERYLSNRVFNDGGLDIFSENDVSQMAWAWGQFLDHTFGLRMAGDEEAPLGFDASDPLEDFSNDLGAIAFNRSAVAAGTGVDGPAEQVNTVSSFIDAWAVYGGTADRLDWLRVGPADGDPANNEAALLMTGDAYLPTVAARGDAAAAPAMELPGALRMAPDLAIVAGDVRANENLALTALHTLFAREHNRIVAALPDDLSEEVKFAIARRVVAAEQQFVTYTEFLPALGVGLDPYNGYDPGVDPSITNEFATAAYRAHSMIHGGIRIVAPADRYTSDELDAFERAGMEVEQTAAGIEVTIPLATSFGRPQLLPQVGVGELLVALTAETQYANDEQIDNQLRSVLFQMPAPGTENPAACFEGAGDPSCFSGVIDLGALDVARGRDHGIASYNDLRIAFGLAPATSFTDITGEDTAEFPSFIDPDDPLDDTAILEITQLLAKDGGKPQVNGDVVGATRASTLAARLEALYGDVDAVDAFVGMVAEPHVPGTEFGELQLAMWEAQFSVLRDGDRFFYANDPVLEEIGETYGIAVERSLAEIIVDNTPMTSSQVPGSVFVVQAAGDDGVPGSAASSVEASPGTAPAAGATGPVVTPSPPAAPTDTAGPAGDERRRRGPGRGDADQNGGEDGRRRGRRSDR